MGAPVLQTNSHGFPAQYCSEVYNLYPNQQGDNVNVTVAAGDVLVAIALGLKDYDPFDLLYSTTTAPGYLLGINDYNQNPIITDGSSDSVAVTSINDVSTAYSATSVDASIGSTAVYHGTFATGLAGYYFTVAGFVGANNNGFFLCTASSATTLTLANPIATLETHAATATDYVVSVTTASNNFNVGDAITLSGIVTETWLNGQTTNVVTAGAVFTVNDHAKHASSGPTAQTTAFAARTSGNDYTLQANLNQFGSDYTVSATPPTAPSPYPSVKWSLDGYLPSIAMWSGVNLSPGTYNVNLNSMFQTGTAPNWQYGRPIFDGGVNFIVIKFTGMVGASADGTGTVSTSSSTANPAVAPAFTTSGTGDLVVAVGLQKSANGLGLGNPDATLTAPGYQRVANGKLVGSEAHYLIEWAIQTAAGSYTPQFANPLGYETLIAAIAIQHT